MLWEPTASAVVENVVTPAAFRVPVPSVAAPSLNVIVPVGVRPPATPVTVAVKVTLLPEKDGLSEETSAVLELALLTVCVMVSLLLL